MPMNSSPASAEPTTTLPTLVPSPPRVRDLERLGDEIAELSAHLDEMEPERSRGQERLTQPAEEDLHPGHHEEPVEVLRAMEAAARERGLALMDTMQQSLKQILYGRENFQLEVRAIRDEERPPMAMVLKE